MACSGKLFRVCIWILGKPIQRKIPGDRVSPFMAEHLDRGISVQTPADANHESLSPPGTVSKKPLRKVRQSDDHGLCRRAVFTQAGQHRLERTPAITRLETNCRGPLIATASVGKDTTTSRSGARSLVPWILPPIDVLVAVHGKPECPGSRLKQLWFLVTKSTRQSTNADTEAPLRADVFPGKK